MTSDGLCPGLNVLIREITMQLNYNYKVWLFLFLKMLQTLFFNQVENVYGSKFGWEGIVEEEFIKMVPSEVKTIHHRGGSYIGTSRSGFNKDKIINSLVKNGFN